MQVKSKTEAVKKALAAMKAEGIKASEAARRYGISASTISRALSLAAAPSDQPKKYSQSTRWTLSPEIFARINNEFKDEKIKFSSLDFMDLAKKHHKGRASVSKILAHLATTNKITVVGKTPAKRGGWGSNLYQAVSGASFVDKYDPDYREKEVSKEQRNSECGVRLHEVLNKIVRRNAARA